MKERPILFSDEMVRAILEGRKTQTRRVVVAPQWSDGTIEIDADGCPCTISRITGCEAEIYCPYGTVGDRLWVREAWNIWHRGPVEWDTNWSEVFDPFESIPLKKPHFRGDWSVHYRIDKDMDGPWRPSVHMPRWASRITLGITNVRVERVQDISEEDAKAEGCDDWIPCGVYTGLKSKIHGGARRKGSYKEYFERLWDSINAKCGFDWKSNPWVWVIEFKRCE